MAFQRTRGEIHKALFDKLSAKQGEVEALRKSYMKKQIRWTILVGLFLAAYTVFVVTYLLSTDFLKYFSIVGYLLIIAISLPPPFKTYVEEYKKTVIPMTAKVCGYTYQQGGHTAWDALTEPKQLFGQFKGSEHSDGFHGQYREIAIAFENIHLFWENQNYVRRTRFKGLLISLTGLTHAGARVLLRTADPSRLARNHTGQELSPMARVTFEDARFERQFDVYSTDQIKAKRILTARMIEQLTEITRFYDGAPVKAAFIEDTLFIAVEKAHIFFKPPPLFRHVQLTTTAEWFIAGIGLLHQMVDSLCGQTDT